MSGNGGNGAPHAPHSGGFAFTAENRKQAETIIARYPAGRQASAVMPLLDLAQRQCGGWLPREAIEAVADSLAMPHIRAYEVATFYTMYNLEPVGRHMVQVCTTTPCWLMGCDGIAAACREALGVEFGETTEDGLFTLKEVECLGACVNGPMIQIDDDYYEDLTPARVTQILEQLKTGRKPEPGPQGGRRASEPEGGRTTLQDGIGGG